MKKFIGALAALFAPLFLISSVLAQEAGPLVCLDPGHGGNTGAYNPSYNLWEDEINLNVALRVENLFLNKGYVVGMTRRDNTYKSNNARYTYCNSIGADILVSIHTNSSTDKDLDGSLGLYFHKDDKVLAKAMYEIMYPKLRDYPNVTWNFTDFGLDRFASGVLLKSNMPSAMMETVMMSHSGEVGLLSDASGVRRQLIAQSIFEGVENYFTNYTGNGGSGGHGGSPKCPNPPCKK